MHLITIKQKEIKARKWKSLSETGMGYAVPGKKSKLESLNFVAVFKFRNQG